MRFCGLSRAEIGIDDVPVNVLELLGMGFSACVLIVLREHFPTQAGDFVLLRGDNEGTVQWARRCRGGRESRSRALMSFMGVLKISSGWKFYAMYVTGAFNDVADVIST